MMDPGRVKSRGTTVPLVVDVDGSLVSGDLLVESALRVFASTPFGFLRLTLPLLARRAALKRAVSRAAPVPPSSLVINQTVVSEIDAAVRSGRPVWLASGSDELVVQPLAEQLRVSGIMASDGKVNLVGRVKADALVERFGKNGFDYIGNSRRDVVVWKESRQAIAVGASGRLQRALRTVNNDVRFLPGVGGPLDYLRALRPHQWVKNVLVFVAVAAAHVVEIRPYLAAIGAFIALSAIASATYVFNDLLDIQYDRDHPEKSRRPMAACKVRIPKMLVICVFLVAAGLAFALYISRPLGRFVLLYLAVALCYSLLLKRIMFVDVIVLASLYVVRVLAGSAAADVTVSPWLLAFSMFFFLSLAIVKRRKELSNVLLRGKRNVDGRGYIADDAFMMAALGAASGFGSVIVLALYVQSPEVMLRYGDPALLWLSCPLLLFWLGRLLLLANRGAVDDDPVLFAVRDRTSWVCCFLITAVVVAAI